MLKNLPKIKYGLTKSDFCDILLLQRSKINLCQK